MSLVADYGSSSDSENSDLVSTSSKEIHGLCEAQEEEEEDSSQDEELSQPPTVAKLPPPSFFICAADTSTTTHSVFVNPFVEAENAKQAVLEKHVKMVTKQESLKIINGKKVCWNYRKGRCRFGHNCKYAHDSDLQLPGDRKPDTPQHEVVFQNKPLQAPTASDLDEMKSESVNTGKQRKRPGLAQGLVPGKKVMKSFYRQRVQLSSNL